MPSPAWGYPTSFLKLSEHCSWAGPVLGGLRGEKSFSWRSRDTGSDGEGEVVVDAGDAGGVFNIHGLGDMASGDQC